MEEDGADAATQDQRQAARGVIESGQELFLPKTVALELEWVLRGYDGFARCLRQLNLRPAEAAPNLD